MSAMHGNAGKYHERQYGDGMNVVRLGDYGDGDDGYVRIAVEVCDLCDCADTSMDELTKLTMDG